MDLDSMCLALAERYTTLPKKNPKKTVPVLPIYQPYVNDEHLEPEKPEFKYQSITPSYSLPLISSTRQLALHRPSEMSQFFPQSDAPRDVPIENTKLTYIPTLDLGEMGEDLKSKYEQGRKKALQNVIHKTEADTLEIRPKSPGADMDLSEYIDPNVGVIKPTFKADFLHTMNSGQQTQIEALIHMAKTTEKLEKEKYEKHTKDGQLVKETLDILRAKRMNPLGRLKEPIATRRVPNELG